MSGADEGIRASGEGAPTVAYPDGIDVENAGDGAAKPARVLLLSQRNIARNRAHVTQFEFEDVIAEVDAVHMLAPPAAAHGEAAELAWRVYNQGRQLVGQRKAPPIAPHTVQGEYDLFAATFHFAPELHLLDAMRGWRARCRKAVCFIIELWSPDVHRYRRLLRLLDDFDQVFVFNAANIPLLSQYTTAPIAFLPTATDAERFCPYPAPPDRVVDFYSYGRRSPATHRALLELTARDRQYYVYDTTGPASIPDYHAHRALLTSTLQRSRYTLAYSINSNRRVRTGGDEALTTRYFEAAAGGSVMLGSAPECPEWEQCFGWPDAVIDIPYEATNIEEIVAVLDADPERVARARQRGLVNSLEWHDWVHRWATMLDHVGLPPTIAMRRRVQRLDRLVAQIGTDAAVRDGIDAERAPGRRAERHGTTMAAVRPWTVESTPRSATLAPERPALALVRPGNARDCPNCAERVPPGLDTCPFCGNGL